MTASAHRVGTAELSTGTSVNSAHTDGTPVSRPPSRISGPSENAANSSPMLANAITTALRRSQTTRASTRTTNGQP